MKQMKTRHWNYINPEILTTYYILTEKYYCVSKNGRILFWIWSRKKNMMIMVENEMFNDQDLMRIMIQKLLGHFLTILIPLWDLPTFENIFCLSKCGVQARFNNMIQENFFSNSQKEMNLQSASHSSYVTSVSYFSNSKDSYSINPSPLLAPKPLRKVHMVT